MHVQYKMIPCSGFIEVQSVDADADTDADTDMDICKNITWLSEQLCDGWMSIHKICVNSRTTRSWCNGDIYQKHHQSKFESDIKSIKFILQALVIYKCKI